MRPHSSGHPWLSAMSPEVSLGPYGAALLGLDLEGDHTLPKGLEIIGKSLGPSDFRAFPVSRPITPIPAMSRVFAPRTSTVLARDRSERD